MLFTSIIESNGQVCKGLPTKTNAMTKEKEYIGTYKVVKIFRKSQRREVLRRGLTREEAKTVVNRHADSNRHMVVFMKQYTAQKYYI